MYRSCLNFNLFIYLFNKKDFPRGLKRSDLGDLRVLLIIQNGKGISLVGLCCVCARVVRVQF